MGPDLRLNRSGLLEVFGSNTSLPAEGTVLWLQLDWNAVDLMRRCLLMDPSSTSLAEVLPAAICRPDLAIKFKALNSVWCSIIRFGAHMCLVFIVCNRAPGVF